MARASRRSTLLQKADLDPAVWNSVLSGRQAEWIYVAESDGLKRFPYKDGDLRGGR